MQAQKALNLLAKACSKKEYCSEDIMEKLRSWNVSEEETALIIQYLVQHHFIDDKRYALAYVRDKFRFNKWGKQKIASMLRQKGISYEIINEALQTLDQEAYKDSCTSLLQQKLKNLSDDPSPSRLKAKLIRFAAGRGFDMDTIYQSLSEVLSKTSQDFSEE